jgi:hypothetical protein
MSACSSPVASTPTLAAISTDPMRAPPRSPARAVLPLMAYQPSFAPA